MNEEVFQALGMQYIIPEIRENMGEIQAALEHRLPDMVKEEDIKGIFMFTVITATELTALKNWLLRRKNWDMST
jgi:hypothetical protein